MRNAGSGIDFRVVLPFFGEPVRRSRPSCMPGCPGIRIVTKGCFDNIVQFPFAACLKQFFRNISLFFFQTDFWEVQPERLSIPDPQREPPILSGNDRCPDVRSRIKAAFRLPA